jgi:hypothetical protein
MLQQSETQTSDLGDAQSQRSEDPQLLLKITKATRFSPEKVRGFADLDASEVNLAFGNYMYETIERTILSSFYFSHTSAEFGSLRVLEYTTNSILRFLQLYIPQQFQETGYRIIPLYPQDKDEYFQYTLFLSPELVTWADEQIKQSTSKLTGQSGEKENIILHSLKVLNPSLEEDMKNDHQCQHSAENIVDLLLEYSKRSTKAEEAMTHLSDQETSAFLDIKSHCLAVTKDFYSSTPETQHDRQVAMDISLMRHEVEHIWQNKNQQSGRATGDKAVQFLRELRIQAQKSKELQPFLIEFTTLFWLVKKLTEAGSIIQEIASSQETDYHVTDLWIAFRSSTIMREIAWDPELKQFLEKGTNRDPHSQGMLLVLFGDSLVEMLPSLHKEESEKLLALNTLTTSSITRTDILLELQKYSNDNNYAILKAKGVKKKIDNLLQQAGQRYGELFATFTEQLPTIIHQI